MPKKLRLKKRSLPHFEIECDLPVDYAAEGEETCFIRFKGRAGGPVNIDYTRAMKEVELNSVIMDRQNAENQDDADVYIRNTDRNVDNIMRQRYQALYQTCVIDWETNIVDADEKPIDATEENFLDLCGFEIPELQVAIARFEAEAISVGSKILKTDEETEKN